MVVGLLGNESSDSNRFTLVTPKSENDVRLQATLDNQNPTGLPVGAVRLALYESEEIMERLKSDCLECMMGRHLTKFPDHTPEEKRVEYMQKLFTLFANAPVTYSAPVLTREINRLQAEMFGTTNEYGEIKKHFNEIMMGYSDMVKEKIASADDSLKLACQYAMVGNYIDFGAMKNVDQDYLTTLLENAQKTNVDENEYLHMKNDLENGKRMVFITDNCGEVVMDKILIETIQQLYPDLDITVIVRGEEVLNDATMTDAEQIGLTKIVKVIGNGTEIAGTVLDEISEEALTAIDKADLVIAKGQGNFETMRNCKRNVYYLFLCKCNMFAKDFNVEKFTGMLVNDYTWSKAKGYID